MRTVVYVVYWGLCIAVVVYGCKKFSRNSYLRKKLKVVFEKIKVF